MTSQVFRPRLPVDPFTAIDHDTPWSIPHNIPPSHPQTILILGGQSYSFLFFFPSLLTDCLLCIEPTIHDLIPLLTSIHFSHSLVLIATHTPPSVPPETQGPALRILRLSQPLAAHDAGALRLVSLLECAQRVPHLWPRDSSPHTIQLAQPFPDGDFSIIETVSHTHPTEKSTINELRRYPSPAPSTSSSKRRSGLSPHKKLHHPKSPQKPSKDKVDYKPFDVIINFLPHGLPDKALLKHAILVTTLSSQFLASPTYISTTASPQTDSHNLNSNRLSISSPSYSYSSASSSSSGSTADTSPCPSPQPRRLSILATSTSKAKNRLSHLFHAVPPPPPLSPPEASSSSNVEESWKVKNAHLVHVLPLGWSHDDSGMESDRSASSSSSSLLPLKLPGPSRSAGYIKTPTRDRTGGICSKPKLVQSIEQFLLSFAYPLGSLVSSQFDGSGGSGAGLLSPSSSSNSKKRPKSALVHSSTSSKGHDAFSRTFTTSNFTTAINFNNMPIKPVPYLLAPGVFASRARGSRLREDDHLEQQHFDDRDTSTRHATLKEMTALTIGEIILLGALDFDHTRPGTGPGDGRAWIGDVGDVVVDGGGGGGGGSPGPGFSSSRKVVGIEKGKGREVGVENIEMMMMKKTTKPDFNGLLTPPESLSSNISVGSEEVEEIHLDDRGNGNSTLKKTRSKPATKRTTSSSPPISTPFILKPKWTNDTNTSGSKVKDENPDSLPSSPSLLQLPSKLPVQLAPLVVQGDRTCSSHGSRRDSYDLGFGNEVPVLPPMTVSIKAGSRSASGSGMGSAMTLPLQTQGDDDSAYGKTGRSPRKESERKGFVVSVLKKMGLLNVR